MRSNAEYGLDLGPWISITPITDDHYEGPLYTAQCTVSTDHCTSYPVHWPGLSWSVGFVKKHLMRMDGDCAACSKAIQTSTRTFRVFRPLHPTQLHCASLNGLETSLNYTSLYTLHCTVMSYTALIQWSTPPFLLPLKARHYDSGRFNCAWLTHNGRAVLWSRAGSKPGWSISPRQLDHPRGTEHRWLAKPAGGDLETKKHSIGFC